MLCILVLLIMIMARVGTKWPYSCENDCRLCLQKASASQMRVSTDD